VSVPKATLLKQAPDFLHVNQAVGEKVVASNEVIGEVQASFPDNTYGVDSGGDPTVIPNLTFQQFQVSSCFFVLD